MEFEDRGIPTVTLFTEAFEGLARAVAMGHSFPDLHRVILPHPLNDRSEEFIHAAIDERIGAITGGLTGQR